MTRRGFSLIEVLIGVALFLIGFVPILSMLFGSEKAAVETQRGIQAVEHAHMLLEEVASLPYAMIPASPRVSDADYIARVSGGTSGKAGKSEKSGKSVGTADGLFDKPEAEYAECFDRSIEVVEGEYVKRIKVTVVDRHVANDTAGKRGETVLQTLVIR